MCAMQSNIVGHFLAARSRIEGRRAAVHVPQAPTHLTGKAN